MKKNRSQHGDKELTVTKRKSKTKAEDDIISLTIGAFGKWQCGLAIMMSLLKIPVAWFQLGIVFLAPPTDFWCRRPITMNDIPLDTWKKISHPINSSACIVYQFSKVNAKPVLCKEFDFDTSTFKSSMITKWSLICSKSWMVEASQTILMFGVLLGNIIFGILSDRMGRQRPLMAAIFIQTICSMLSAISPTYGSFVFIRFVLALASGGICIISFVLVIESVGGYYRTVVPILYQIPFGLGVSMMAGLAYGIRDMKELLLTIGVLSSLFLGYFWGVDESPRWLLANKHDEKATDILEKAAAVNKMNVTNVKQEVKLYRAHHSEIADGKQKPNVMTIFKTANMRNVTLLLCSSWFVSGMSFFAFSQYLGHLGRNIFLTVALSGLIPLIGSSVCIYFVSRIGRKLSIAFFQFATGLCFVCILIFPIGKYAGDWPRIAFAVAGMAGMSISMPALYLYSGELFPTSVRNAGLGAAAMFGRLGSMVAPFVVSWNGPAPLLLLAGVSMVQAFLVLPLPETMGQPLMNTIDDAEFFYM